MVALWNVCPCSAQSLLPNVVTTNMSKVRRQSLFTPSPATFVKSAVGTIGILSRTSGYWPHSFQVSVALLVVESITALCLSPLKDEIGG